MSKQEWFELIGRAVVAAALTFVLGMTLVLMFTVVGVLIGTVLMALFGWLI